MYIGGFDENWVRFAEIGSGETLGVQELGLFRKNGGAGQAVVG
jgi:hypothetical protein